MITKQIIFYNGIAFIFFWSIFHSVMMCLMEGKKGTAKYKCKIKKKKNRNPCQYSVEFYVYLSSLKLLWKSPVNRFWPKILYHLFYICYYFRRLECNPWKSAALKLFIHQWQNHLLWLQGHLYILKKGEKKIKSISLHEVLVFKFLLF